MELARKNSDAGSVVWACQSTLARRYDMSKSNMYPLLLGGVSSKNPYLSGKIYSLVFRL